jgi:medium-chain acyl-[acyl-carrier-protein] hydrolase
MLLKSAWFPACGINPEARLRLFCFAHAGGGAHLFAMWSRIMPRWIEVVGCQLPGRNERLREPLPLRMDRLLDALEPEIRPRLNLPFAFFGHSLGARVAFYLARRLRSSGGGLPQALFASACSAPHLPSRLGPIHALPLRHFVEELQCRYEPIPELILRNPEALDMFLSVLRADFSVLETKNYTVETPLACPIVAYIAKDDATVSASDVEAWSVHTSAAFRAEILAGDHFYLRSSTGELLASLVAALQPCLTHPAQKLQEGQANSEQHLLGAQTCRKL